MKILLYSDMLDKIGKSGLGQAIHHQQKALELAGVDYTFDPEDTFDILHINTYFLHSYLFVKKCVGKGIPVIYHAHSTMEDFRNSFKFSNLIAPVFKTWLVNCYRTADVLITPTEYSRRILKSYGLKQDIYAVSNGIDVSSFARQPNAREVFCKKYGFSNNDFIVMGVGLFIARKGILDFINLAKKMPDIQFIWFGETDFKLIPQYIQAAIINHPKNLNFAGYVPNAEIKTAMQACNVFFMPTYEETEGIPVLEACACGTPAVIRDIPVFNPWLEDKKHVYKGKSLGEFAHLIRGIQSGTLRDLSAQAYEVAAERDLAIIGARLKNIYRSVLRTYQPRRKFSLRKVSLLNEAPENPEI